MPKPTVTRLTTPAQMVASLPLWLGYVPTESLVVACCHEPRGRVGLTLRFDLPRSLHEQDLVEEVVRRVVHQLPTRVLVAVYTQAADGRARARQPLVDELCDQLQEELPGLVVTEAVLVRDARFWSYLCQDPRCCPPEGTPVDTGAHDPVVALLQAEQVLRGQVVLPDRDALERTLAAPGLLEAEASRQACAEALADHARWRDRDLRSWRERWLTRWSDHAQEVLDGAGAPDLAAAAALATSLEDVLLRDTLVAEHEPEQLLPLVRRVARQTAPPFDAGVCTVLAWLSYCDGGGAEVTIALERAQQTDPAYSLANLLAEVVHGQVPPVEVRRISREASLPRAARRRAPRSPRSRGSAS